MAILAIGCRGGEAPSCPRGTPLEVDLAAWHQAIKTVDPAANGASAYDLLLAELGLESTPRRASEELLEEAVMTLVSVEVAELRRGSGETPDQLVTARFSSAAGAESLRAQLLRPLCRRQGVYCPLGDGLSRDTETFEEPCLKRHAGAARSLAFESLIAPDRDAIVVRDAGGWCGPGTSRGDRFVTSYWGVEQDRLVRYLEAVTFESWYESPEPPVEIRRSVIELSSTWPRAITLTEVVECRKDDEPAPDNDCEPFAGSREYRYVDNRYLVTNDSPPAAASPTEHRSEETAH